MADWPLPIAIFFIALTVPTCWLVLTLFIGAAAGWFGLQEQFSDTGEAAVLDLRGQSGLLGNWTFWAWRSSSVLYWRCLRFQACPTGLRVSIAFWAGPSFKPFFLPWAQIRVEENRFMGFRRCRLAVVDSGGIGLTIGMATYDRIRLAVPQSGWWQLD